MNCYSIIFSVLYCKLSNSMNYFHYKLSKSNHIRSKKSLKRYKNNVGGISKLHLLIETYLRMLNRLFDLDRRGSLSGIDKQNLCTNSSSKQEFDGLSRMNYNCSIKSQYKFCNLSGKPSMTSYSHKSHRHTRKWKTKHAYCSDIGKLHLVR